MSEWHPNPSRRLQAAPPIDNHRDTDRFRPWSIYIALAAVAVITAIVAAVILLENPARSAADRAAAESTIRPASSPPGAVVPWRKPVEMFPPVPDAIGADGTYLVGREIKTGTYRSAGGDRCYWARLRNTSGELAAVIAAGYHRGRQYVTITKGDRAFLTDRCGPWEMIP